MRDYNIKSDLKQEKFEVIKLVQGDKGNKLTINVLEDGKPVSLTGCSITAKYKRADGQVINGSVTNISNNSFDAVIDSDITKVVGTLKMLFSIEKDDVRVSTFLLLADVREGIGENTGSSGGSTGGGEVTVDLSNYYKKNETYSKAQIDSQFKDIANDLELDNSNNLHLINKNGEKVGNGVTLSMNSGGGNDSNYSNLCTFTDAYVAWCNNETFPIAFYGDSTFFGTNTSSGNTFCDVLQTLLRQECGGNATIYRVAVAGTALADGVNGFESYFGTGQSYANTKMIGIGYGINDRLGYNTLKDYKNGVYEKVETLIKNAMKRGYNLF